MNYPHLESLLQVILLEQIPISQAMGINVDLASLHQVVLSAPIDCNINHKKTVFGGSLHAVATLASWCLIHLNLAKIYGGDVQVVISKSDVNYRLPVSSDFKASCTMPEASQWERFIKILKKKGKARIKLHATISQDNQLAVDYFGVFVAIDIANSKNGNLTQLNKS